MTRFSYLLGVAAQGVALGSLLLLALFELWALTGDVRLFRYQNF